MPQNDCWGLSASVGGDNITVALSLLDNAGAPVENASINVSINGLISFEIFTDENGFRIPLSNYVFQSDLDSILILGDSVSYGVSVLSLIQI